MLIRHATPAEMKDPVEFTVQDPVGSVDAGRFLATTTCGAVDC